jgi:hypothetical protein
MRETTDAQVARDWRKRAEAFWKLSKLLDDLAVRYRNAAHWCDLQADAWDRPLDHDRGPDPHPDPNMARRGP